MLKFYWSSPHTQSFFLSGSPISHLSNAVAPDKFTAGGIRFDPNYPNVHNSLWNSFGQQLWINSNTLNETDWLKTAPLHEMPGIIHRSNRPEFGEWSKMIDQAYQSFLDENRKKIVLAREVTLELEFSPNPLAILRALSGIDSPEGRNNLTLFCIQPNSEESFIGATPETLYRRQGRLLYTEAVAGTRSRGSSQEEDCRLANDLLSSKKDLEEHRLVGEMIRNELAAIGSNIEVDRSPFVLKGKYWQHLKQSFRCYLHKHITDEQILAYLHPTPAVGGYPKTGAIELIRAIEPFDRGWYAGPVGWISDDAAEFAVAIRSAHIKGNKITLFSGLGVVDGSDSIDEWNELELKLEQYLSIFLTGVNIK